VLNTTGAAPTATVYQSDGSQVTFAINPDGTFRAAGPWVEATLAKQSDGSYLYSLPDRTSLTFDSIGRFVSEADRNANAITASYNGSGQITKLTDDANRSITLAYNPDGTVKTATDPDQQQVSYSYTSGDLVSVSDLNGKLWRFGYDTSNQMTSMKDPNNHGTDTAYDSSGRVVSQIDSMSRKRTWDYSMWGSGHPETKVTNPGGDVTDMQFDTAYQPVQITHAQGTPDAGTVNYAYDANNFPASTTDANNHQTMYSYDSAGDLTSETDPLNHTTSWTYDAQRDLPSITTALNHKTTFVYDSRGNLTSMSRPVTETSQTQTTTYTHAPTTGDLTSLKDPGPERERRRRGRGRARRSTAPESFRCRRDFDASHAF
jgi:YD repeat-containing protein